MNERNHPDDSIEMRLDRLIDALNAGAPLSAFASDPELRDLADVVRATDSVRETQWPDSGFGKRMAARLSAELNAPGYFASRDTGARLFDLPTAPASLNGLRDAPPADAESGPFDLAIPRRESRLKMLAQMAAALAGFAILTFILITVFRGAPEEESVGNAPPDSTATTMSVATASPTTAASTTATAGDSQILLVPTPPSTPNASLVIVPYELSCATSAAVTGGGFVPGAQVDIFLGAPGEIPDAPDGSAVASNTAGDDGSFQFTELVPTSTLIPNCEERAATGSQTLTFTAASVIEVDGQERYAEPAVQTQVVLAPEPAAAEPGGATLTLEPAIATCDATVTASGTGFEPGTQISFIVFQLPGDNGFTLEQHPEVGEDGTFTVDLELSRQFPCGGQIELPAAGLLYGFDAITGTGPKPDNDDWREPSAQAILTVVPDSETASPEALEQLMVDQAVAAAREFLAEPGAEFEVLEVHRTEERYVRIGREVDGAYDEFSYDVGFQRLTSATVQSHASGWSPVEPVDTERAMEIAEQTAREHHPFFDQLTLYETTDQSTVPGADQQDRVFTATWQIQSNNVWLPTVLKVSVDMETGLVTGYHFSQERYFGPLEPAIAEADAVAAAEEAIATEPTLAGATVGKIELTTSYKVLELDENGNVVSGEWILVWRIYLDNRPESAPAPYIEVDALTGELLTDFGEPGGAG